MKKKILTVSIAAYNVEAYIRQALNSLIDERIIDDLEVFVIDDGGTDRTLEIAKEYAAKYPNSIFPVHKENGGYGTTVNYSMAHATGKYFKLLDGDDWFDVDGLFMLVSELKKCETDVIFTPFYKWVTDEHMKLCALPENVEYGREILASKLSSIFYPLPMHAITYKTEVIKKTGLQLPPNLLYTDGLYSIVPFALCKTSLFLESPVYYYRIGSETQSISRASKVKHTDDYHQVLTIMLDFYEHKKEEEIENIKQIFLQVVFQYLGFMKILFLYPISNDMRKIILSYEHDTYLNHTDVYITAGKQGKMGKLLLFLRKTDYLPYLLLKLLPGGFPYKPGGIRIRYRRTWIKSE